MKLTKLLILFLLLSLKGFSQQVPVYSFKYDKTEFCAGSNGFSSLLILNDKNEVLSGPILKHAKFSYSTISGNGILKIDENGKIDQNKSDAGKYIVEIKFSGILEKITITINNCR